MHRILKSGGKFILAIPTMEGISLSDKLRGLLRHYRTFGGFRAPGSRLYTHQSLPPVIAQGGFRILVIEQLTDPTRPGGFSGLYVRAEKNIIFPMVHPDLMQGISAELNSIP